MADSYRIGDRVQIYLDPEKWGDGGWFEGTVVRIDPYSGHRSFHWVEVDEGSAALLGGGTRLISVFNPKNIRRVPE